MKVNVSVERFETGVDLRVTGNALSTGCKATYILNGKKRVNKIYMKNSGGSLDFYVKPKGKRVSLQSEEIIYHLHTSHLTSVLWFIEIN